jgi:hypothetical protein
MASVELSQFSIYQNITLKLVNTELIIKFDVVSCDSGGIYDVTVMLDDREDVSNCCYVYGIEGCVIQDTYKCSWSTVKHRKSIITLYGSSCKITLYSYFMTVQGTVKNIETLP